MNQSRPALPSFERTTALVARALGTSPDRLVSALVVARADDLDDVVAFRRECFGGALPWDDHRYLAWRYGLNRESRAFGKLRVLRLDGSIVGIIGVEEFELRTGETRVAAACPMDLVAHPGRLDVGLGAWLNLHLANCYPALVALGANQNSLGLVTRLYTAIPGRTTLKFPLNVSEYLGRRLAVPFAGAVIGAAANAGLRLRFAKKRVGMRRAAVDIALHERFDAAWDEAIGAAGSDAVAVHRTTGYLNWRFAENPRARYSIVAATSSAGRLRAYAVFRSPRRGANVHVHDYWHAADGDAALSAVMVRVVDLARENGSRFVSAAAMSASSRAALSALGFVPRESSPLITAVLARPSVATLTESAKWAMTDLGDDSDGPF